MVIVRHALGSYPVIVEPGALGRLGPLAAEHAGGRRLALITDSNVGPLFGQFRAGPSRWRAAGGRVELPAFGAELTVPAGEESKSREQWAALSDQLLDRG